MTTHTYSDTELHAYLDGEMSPQERGELETWLDANPEAAGRLLAFRTDLECLQARFGPVLDEPVPERLTALLSQRAGQHRRPPVWRMIAAALALFVAGAGTGWMASRQLQPPVERASSTVAAALSAHRVYTAEVRHAVEVGADEEAHLVRWLSNRLGSPLRAPMLQDAGFELVGGRLLPAEDAAAAQFMYENDAGERVTIYVATNPAGGKTEFKLARYEPTQAFHWLDGTLGYAIAGEI
ncbi:MAG: anti-sigma factor family protein, partial [Alphaproteobacteria bacterium]